MGTGKSKTSVPTAIASVADVLPCRPFPLTAGALLDPSDDPRDEGSSLGFALVMLHGEMGKSACRGGVGLLAAGSIGGAFCKVLAGAQPLSVRQAG